MQEIIGMHKYVETYAKTKDDGPVQPDIFGSGELDDWVLRVPATDTTAAVDILACPEDHRCEANAEH
eukprot:736663-Amphidinium_carterae.1